MNYEIRQFDRPLLRFSATEDTAEPEIRILWLNEDRKDLFPLDMEISEKGIARWLAHRTIPKNRAYVRNFLSKCGLNLNRPLNIIKVSKGLSLNDCYWVVEEYSFLPVGRMVSSGGMKAVREYYRSLGKEFVTALDDMLVLDALIFNTDRHFGNFGFLVDNRANRIAAPAPLFDHGNSLFNFAGSDDLSSAEALKTYADTLLPCVYDDYVGTAKQVLTSAHKEGLRHLLNFRFKKHPRYNLPKDRMKLIEKMIAQRAGELLGGEA